jgi:hexosaminidase
MIFPRLAALSEALWSPKELRDWNYFTNRITSMFKRYELLDINYAKSAYLVTADTQINLEENIVEVLLKNEFPNSDIRYTIDGTDLNSTSKKYSEPIKITETTNLKASLFENNQPIGKEFNQSIKFHKAVGKKVSYKEIYNDNYQGAGEFTLVNTLRGTKNFHDGQWQAWLGKDMEVVIDLEKETSISEVTVGSMENQGPGIYYPIKIEVFVSLNGKDYKHVGNVERAYAKNPGSELKEFKIEFSAQKAQYVKVIATNLKNTPEGGDTWLFIDEILID